MPRGNRPSMAAFTSVGDRKASEIVMLTLPHAAFFAGGDRFDIGNGAGDNLIEPASAAGDRRHKRERGSQNGWGEHPGLDDCGCNDLASPFQVGLFPGNMKDGIVCFSIGRSIALSCQLDHDLIRVNFDPTDICVDEIAVGGRGWFFEALADGVDDKGFDLGGRDPANGSGMFSLALRQCRGEIVAILDATFSGVAWGHPIAAIIEDATDQQRLGACTCDRVIGALLIEFGLDSLEQLSIQDGRLLAGKDLTLERDLTDVEPVAQQMGERATG